MKTIHGRDALKNMYIKHKHYHKRGYISRMNKMLYRIYKKEGHDEWVRVIENISEKIF